MRYLYSSAISQCLNNLRQAKLTHDFIGVMYYKKLVDKIRIREYNSYRKAA